MTSQTSHYTFTGPDFHTKLSPLDQIAVYNWSPRIFIFPLSPSTTHDEITAVLRTGMQATINAFPDLAGTCTEPPQSRPGDTQGGMRYHDKGEAHLRIRDFSDRPEYNLSTLRASKFSQERLLPEDLCPTPGFAHPAMQPLELFSVQANFVQGGLLLVVCIYHSICDGVGQFHVTEMLAKQCRLAGLNLSKTTENGKTNLELGFRPDQLDRTTLFQGVPHADMNKLSAYTILPSPARGLPAWAMPDHRKLASETFLLPGPALQELKALATSQKPASSSVPYISTHDAVCALIWRTTMVARLAAQEISGDEATTFGMAVDGRAHLRPKQPADWLGNNAIGFKVSETVARLIAPDNLGAAAFAIRGGVRSVDDAYIRTLITVAEEVPDYGQVFIDMVEFIKTTGLFLTSWTKFPYQGLDFGDRFGKCEGFRFPAGGYMNGIAVMFPPLENGDWEVTLTLEEKCMEAFKNDVVWKRYASTE